MNNGCCGISYDPYALFWGILRARWITAYGQLELCVPGSGSGRLRRVDVIVHLRGFVDALPEGNDCPQIFMLIESR